MKNNLVPTTVTTKNGVTTTVYKKPGDSSSGKPVKLPAPAASQPFHDQLRDGRIDHLVTLLDEQLLIDPISGIKLRKKLASFEDNTLDIIETTAEEGCPISYVTVLKSTENVVREVAFYQPRFTNILISPYEAKVFTTGLHFLDRYKGTTHIETLAGAELDIATAYLNVTEAIHTHVGEALLDMDQDYHNEQTGYIKDPALQALIATHYQQAETIVSYIEERGTADPEGILEYLENDTALKDGVL